MVSKTRNTVYIPATPTKKHQEIYDTIKHTRFFDAITFEGGKKSVHAIAAEVNIHHTTAYRWLQQKTLLGSPAYCNNRKQSKILGHKSKLSPKTCKFLVSNNNPVQNQLLDTQIEYHHIPLSQHQVTRKLKEHTNRGQIYKAAYIQREYTRQNLDKQVIYDTAHKDKPLFGYWDLVYFTDKAHINPSQIYKGGILRERGQCNNSNNIQQLPKLAGTKLHIAAWVNWYEKAEKLEFYNDEEEFIQ